MKRSGLFAAILLLSVPSGAPAADWPVFRGPGSDNAYRGETILGEVPDLGLGIVWEQPLGSGYSGVSVAAGRAITLFADATDDVAAAFDAATGEELWRYPIGPTYRGHDGSHDGPISTPLVAGGRVFALGPWGHFHAIDLETGEKIWSTHLAEDQGAMAPLYGYGSSPVFADGVVIVEAGTHGGPFAQGPPGSGPSILGLDPASGAVLWQAGKDTVNYQSPIPATVGGRRLLLTPTDIHLFGLEPKTGEVLWKTPHGGKFYPGPGLASMNPVALGESRFLLTDTPDSSSLVELAPDADGQMSLRPIWSSRSIRGSYAVPVHYQGHLYAYNSRFLTCVDASTGEMVWRSRQPGDGFLLLVDGHLVVMTKKGSLHVAEASPKGYHEVASLQVLEDGSWTPPSFADGRIYARGLGGITAVELKADAPATVAETGGPAGTRFARFLAEVEAAPDKAAAIDRFMESQESFPVIEDEWVHFLYRGPAQDMGIAGDMIGDRKEEPMARVAGTELLFFSTRLKPDARVSYTFTRDFEERLTDPLNPRTFPDLTGEVSWLAMPGWQAPTHLDEAPEERRGRIESHEIADHKVDVYLPAGYDPSTERRYAVTYVHGGGAAMGPGSWPRTLDNLIGRTVEPHLVVFVHAKDPQAEFLWFQRDVYAATFAERIVPAIDEKYPTLATRESRASAGAGPAGYAALYGAFKYPGLIGRVASQSTFLLTMQAMPLIQLAGGLAEQSPPAIFLQWGTYDQRSEDEAWDFRAENKKLAELLRSHGFEVTASEVPDGTGWASWHNRNDQVLEWLFPMTR